MTGCKCRISFNSVIQKEVRIILASFFYRYYCSKKYYRPHILWVISYFYHIFFGLINKKESISTLFLLWKSTIQVLLLSVCLPFCLPFEASSLQNRINTAFFNASDRNRTGTGFKSRRILSPVRLPVPPLRHLVGPIGLEPMTLCL